MFPVPVIEIGASVSNLLDDESRFFARNLQRTFLQIYRIVRNHADAQDLTQETFIKALQRQDQLKDQQKVTQWLSRIARNTAIDFLRHNKHRSVTTIENAPEGRSESAEERLLRSEKKRYLEDGLRVLTARERAALILRDVEGLPPDRVAKQMGCSMATVRSHIASARVKLRRYLPDRAYSQQPELLFADQRGNPQDRSLRPR